MGSGSSKSSGSFRSSSSSWANSPSYPEENQYYAQPSSYPQEAPYSYNPQPQPYGRTQNYNAPPTARETPKKRLERKYSRIADDYTSLEQVTEALARAGLESSNLIIGVDFTKSNEWTGARSFNRKSLHHIGSGPNPYEQAITIIGKTLAAFDEDNLIPCYGFGDASTHDQDVFNFHVEKGYCNGFEEVLSRYREIVPQLKLAGPTSFAPVIEMATTICEQSGGQYHVLLIIADGQMVNTFVEIEVPAAYYDAEFLYPCCGPVAFSLLLSTNGLWLSSGASVKHIEGLPTPHVSVRIDVTRSVDTERGQLSPQEQMTVDAIVAASKYPLSIVLVGVGDGPWDMMKEFDDNIPSRDFDNFQFVNFTEIMAKHTNPTRKETEFALAALMEIPSQYKATLELNILGKRTGFSPERVALPPPMYNAPFGSAKAPSRSTSFQQSTPRYREERKPVGKVTTRPGTSSSNDNQVCPICLTNNKDMAFGCGHQVCCDCGPDLDLCPICRRQIEARIRLY